MCEIKNSERMSKFINAGFEKTMHAFSLNSILLLHVDAISYIIHIENYLHVWLWILSSQQFVHISSF